MSNPFKDSSNRWLTSALFVETNDTDGKYAPIFTLGEEDKGDYISLKRKYLEYLDPTEYNFAKVIFGSYLCWENLCKTTWFKEYADQWRKERDLQLQFKNYRTAAEIQSDGTAAEKLTATKWLAEEKWKESTKIKRGRPKNGDNYDPEEDRSRKVLAILKSVKSGT
jgi:hypothetical protein